MGEWRFKQLQLEIEGREERIDLETGRKVPSGRGQQVMRVIPARAVG
jgi:hypothetical protein